jgi:alpha-tubulin suppressor-like RCC1 family protein
MAVLAACGPRPRLEPGAVCDALNSECDPPLVCRLGRCRVECREVRDCAPGQLCVRDGEGLGACQLDEELECTLDSQCADPLVCRNSSCTNACNEDRDCPPPLRCVGPPGAQSCMDESEQDCVLNSQCRAPLVCAVDFRCRPECRTDRDCRDGRACVAGSCAPGTVDAGLEDDGGLPDGGAPPPPDPPVLLAAGFRFACSVRGAGDLRCWGENDSGQLGDGSRVTRSSPVRVDGLAGLTLLEVVAGESHTCARTATELRCWGRNVDGQAGVDAADGVISAPTRVVLPSPPTGLAAGNAHTCALLDDGGVACWGANAAGQLGDGTQVQRRAPVRVTGLTGVVDLGARGNQTCAVLEGGGVRCWGGNGDGQLGIGRTDGAPHPLPEAVLGVDDAVRVFVGSAHACALRRGGAVTCWGQNQFGQAGQDPLVEDRLPTPTALSDVAAAVAGGAGLDHSCLLFEGGGVSCLGNNREGQLGLDPAEPPFFLRERFTPLPITLEGTAQEVRSGGLFNCARLLGGAVYCWGTNDRGQIGNGRRGGVVYTPEEVVF